MNKEKNITTFKGSLFQIKTDFLHQPNKVRFFEKATRPPGVRMVFMNEDSILLSKEFRREIKDWDYRLPGGKVFDTIDEYLNITEKKEDLEDYIFSAVVRESIEEVGIIVDKRNIKIVHKSISGASINWDLYYCLITDFLFDENGQQLEEGEIIDKPIFVKKEKVLNMCLNNQIKEDRSVAVLYRLLGKK